MKASRLSPNGSHGIMTMRRLFLKKFDRLAARNLLHLQGRVMLLEKELDALDREAAKSHDMSIKEAARS